MSSYMSYRRVGLGRNRICHGTGTKGFRLNSRRFSVQGLRERFFYLFRLFSRWRSYGHGRALRLINKLGINGKMSIIGRNKDNHNDKGSRRSLQAKEMGVPISSGKSRLRSSLGRSNSFYSEAIADCLEFIKRSSLSVDQKQPLAACSKMIP